MKKLKLYNGGHPINYNSDLMHLSDAISENANALTAFFGTGTSVYLCDDWQVRDDVFSGTTYKIAGDSSSSGQMAPNTGGAMIYKGELCLFDYQHVPVSAGTLVWEPFPDPTAGQTYDNTAGDPLVYLDGTSHTPHAMKKVRLKYYTSLPTNYVLASSVLTPAQALASMIYGAWQNLTLANGWAAYNGDTPMVKYDADGKVSFRGKLDASSATNSVFTTLSAIYWPIGANDMFLTVNVAGSGKEFNTIQVSHSDGTMFSDYTLDTGKRYELNGLCFYR